MQLKLPQTKVWFSILDATLEIQRTKTLIFVYRIESKEINNLATKEGT